MHEGFNNRRFFDWHGRVSRVQFLAYSTFNVLIALMLVALLFVHKKLNERLLIPQSFPKLIFKLCVRHLQLESFVMQPDAL
jgi:uncharacterized membrane protein YhaH (DUF805 family)